MRLSIMFLLVLAGALSAQVRHQHHPPRSAQEYAHVLDHQSREAWQKPVEVIAALNLQPQEVVADIGAGTGYFAKRMANHAGRVLAVDVEAELLKKLAESAPSNLQTVLATPDDPKLAPASVDTVFFCNVVHHIDERPAYYAKLRKALKPGGRVVVVEFHKRELPVGPPPSMKLSLEEMEAEFKQAGFRLVKSQDFLPYQHFLVFQP